MSQRFVTYVRTMSVRDWEREIVTLQEDAKRGNEPGRRTKSVDPIKGIILQLDGGSLTLLKKTGRLVKYKSVQVEHTAVCRYCKKKYTYVGTHDFGRGACNKPACLVRAMRDSL